MKFLLLYPGSRTGSHTVVYYLGKALTELGHLVYFCNPHDLLRTLSYFEPDVLMVFFGLNVEMDQVKALRDRGVFTVFWGGDEEDWFHYYIRISPEFDLWCCYSTATLHAHLQAGARAIYFPYAADPSLFYPVRLSEEDQGIFKADIAFVGCHYPERERVLKDLATRWKVKAYWSGRETQGLPSEPLDFATIRKIYAGSKVVLDPFSTCDRQRKGVLGAERSYGLPCRSFEVPACRAFALQPFREDLPLLYKIGEEVEVFWDEEEMVEKLAFYLKHPEKRNELASKAYYRTLQEHTYRHRAIRLLEEIERTISKKKYYWRRREKEAPEVSVVMPVFNGLPYTKQAVESLINYTDQPFELIVVDNGSFDGTWRFLTKIKKKNNLKALKLIRNTKNLGFPKACNQGIREAEGRYIVILNNDVVLTIDWLGGLLQHAKADPSVGLVGPMTNYANGEQMIEVPYRTEEEMHRFALQQRKKHLGQSREVERLIAFCLLIKREVLEKVGPFDESFGIGNYEDDDLCMRVRLAGYKAVMALDVFVHHHGSRTFEQLSLDYWELMQKNLKRFKEKWAEPLRREVEELCKRAETLWEEGKREEAVRTCQRAIGMDPQSPRAHNNLAVMQWKLGRHAEALRHLEEAMRLAPEDKDVIWNCGQIMLNMGRIAEAMGLYRAYLRRHHDEAIKRSLEQMEALLTSGRSQGVRDEAVAVHDSKG